MSVNKVILVGRLGRDPEIRYTSGGQAVVNFSIATDESYKDRNGERQKRTEWHRLVVWGKQAEVVQKYLKKGTEAYFEGRLQTREWQDKEGQKKNTTEVVVTDFRFLGGRGEGMAPGAGASAAAPRSDDHEHPAPSDDFGSAPGAPEINDEDIPF
jgi:single-strand DNA-binding protein